jgi:hypothetical protein
MSSWIGRRLAHATDREVLKEHFLGWLQKDLQVGHRGISIRPLLAKDREQG